ncbi:hypothetical protein QLQ86_18115 [Halomonas sp. LR5S13]|uniref:hypothetical protein n=1 Tax=Halomonas rhizosphaerae TaxID=3043296 RepID=UPI0024A8651C|nr:hypothetical protein [Halomonas rhizosphaerae]MDI5922689.1 hypothetical protein [Halomonas rhizosphaerae]
MDFVDIPLDTDLPVFLEPGAIKSLRSPWGNDISSMLQTFFDTVLRLIHSGEHEKAQRLLSSLNERNEFHLGYSSGESRGHGFGSGSAETVWGALSKSNAAVTGLLKDLEDTALLIPGIGTDMISDAVCNIIRGPLIKYTQDMCFYYGVPLTPDVASGPIWNPQQERWDHSLIPLPVTDYGKVILVPKILVRYRLSVQYDEYYRHYILPEMQDEHIKAHSPLVEVLKDGTERVTKKSLIEKYGNDKLAVAEQTKVRPNILQEYKDQKAAQPSNPLTQDQFCELEATQPPDLDPLVTELRSLPTGRDSAAKYEDIIERILSVILYPSLCNPIKQHNIHQGRKRIDITYTNESKTGFFYWLSMHYPCPLMFVECKNYGKEAGNPEIDQLSGRFSPSRGQVGLLICRNIEDKNLLYQRCIDTAKDRRGYMLVLDDEDIFSLVEEYKLNPEDQSFDLLRKLWGMLID